MEQPALREQIVGTWRLVAMRANMGADMPEQPYGPEPLGYITYTADGHMHAILMQRDRPPVGTPMEEFSRRTGLRRLAFLVRELPALARQTSAAMNSMAYSATWELRVRTFRVFYDIQGHPESVVCVRAVGEKRGNRPYVEGREVVRYD